MSLVASVEEPGLQQLEKKEEERTGEIKPPPQQACAAADKSPHGL